ncbi:MAG: NAD-dependent epimerase/dehydratase family protein [Proteobacteria bacterium]|nr:NAD-dependent epimerase/dehydratase family protein [Pseudomonadota bacterium]
MKIVVTGAAGFIGSHLAERLCGQGHAVVGIDCLTDYYARARKEQNAADVVRAGARVDRLDLASDDLTAALAGAEFVYHLAAQPGISATTPFEAYERNNVLATLRLLDALEGSETLRCLVNISTSSVYGADATDGEDVAPKPTSVYGVTKLCAEQLVLARQRDRGTPALSFRIFSVYGPRERPEKLYPMLIHSLLSERPFPLYEGALEHSRSFTFVDDIVDGLVSVLENPQPHLGEIFNLGSETERTTAEGIAVVESILGRKMQVEALPPRPGDQRRTCADITKAAERLGYRPRTELEEGLRREVDWYRQRIWGQLENA